MKEYDYPLPEGRIAKYPLTERENSSLLIYKDGNIDKDVFSNLSTHLPPDSLILFNETRVIHARLVFHKPSGSRIEIFCLEPVVPAEIQIAFQKTSGCTWKCLIGNAKRWKSGALKMEVEIQGEMVELSVEKGEHLDEAFLVHFSWTPAKLSFALVLEELGKIPLPPYIDRDTEEIDASRYQTTYAKHDGSVAAPTAGLHFTPKVIESLEAIGIETGKVTLHVGAGTFKPVNSETLADHSMHTEQVSISLGVIEQLLSHLEKPIILVGTTTVRAIESLYWQGVKWLCKEPSEAKLEVLQWDPYKPEFNAGISLEEALYCVYQVMLRLRCTELRGGTSLLIAPGYRYKVPSAIITNFHQPRSTLLLLVSAFIGDDWKKAYDYALSNGFRFLSYGDSCLFFRKD
ncbi:MAG: S-adenosylmethionine:tRNA ribosyltransferase-isomerase [Bacteroidetes bacterium]|nr:S-adenosylmethionine:tRNA ribosyltransferase-isomerase [Bacteroidota bacterium]